MSTNAEATTRPVFTGEDVFTDFGIKVYVEYRCGRPYVAFEVQGHITWLCPEEAGHLACYLPGFLWSVASKVERLNDEAAL